MVTDSRSENILLALLLLVPELLTILHREQAFYLDSTVLLTAFTSSTTGTHNTQHSGTNGGTTYAKQ